MTGSQTPYPGRQLPMIESGVMWHGLIGRYLNESRTALDGQWIGEVIEAALAHCTILEKGSLLYRARICPPGRAREVFPCSEMGPPPRDLARGGRLNPQGIPYLYLATEPETAIAEMQPWRTATLTVATFEVDSPLSLYDFVDIPAGLEEGLDISRTLSHRLVRRFAASSFSIPAHREDATAYAATQYIAEHLKSAGKGEVQGILYPSSLNVGGKNLALFGPRNERKAGAQLRCIGTELWEVNTVEVSATRKQSK